MSDNIKKIKQIHVATPSPQDAYNAEIQVKLENIIYAPQTGSTEEVTLADALGAFYNGVSLENLLTGIINTKASIVEFNMKSIESNKYKLEISRNIFEEKE